MRLPKSRKTYKPSSILSIFFEDATQMSVVGGKSTYLPLTRRIERGRILKEIIASDEITNTQSEYAVKQIQHKLQLCLDKLLEIVSSEILQKFTNLACEDAEAFFDRAELDAPLSLSNLVKNVDESNEQIVRELGWQYVMVLALLPVDARSQWEIYDDYESVLPHFNKIQDDYATSKQILIEGTLRYSIRLARYYIHSGIPYLDLVQEGFLGLIHAIDKFEEIAGAHFQSYTANWIQQRIRRYIGDHSRLVRIPVHLHDKVIATEQSINELRETRIREPFEEEIFLHLEWMPEEEIASLKQTKKDNELYQRTAKKFEYYRKLLIYRDYSLSKIPPDLRDRVITLDKAYQNLTDKNGQEPDEITLFEHINWLTIHEVNILRNPPKDLRKNEVASLNLRKANKQLNYHRMALARHYPLTTVVIDGKPVFEDYLVLPYKDQDTEDSELYLKIIKTIFVRLDEREQKILNLRFGLVDAREWTLEEIGQMLGVTRERVRQIESKAMRKLHSRFHKSDISEVLESEISSDVTIAERMKYKLIGILDALDFFNQEDKSKQVSIEVNNIEKLLEKYTMSGRYRTRTGHPSRAKILLSILEESKKPLHYDVLHAQILKTLPTDQHYPKERTYATLFYSEYFQLLGNGMFGLTGWDFTTTSQSGEKILLHCPQPLLPENGDTRAFFESIMVARDLLKRNLTITAKDFYSKMQDWAKQNGTSEFNVQAAFDTWYMVGVIDSINVENNPVVNLTISTELKLNEVRLYCLNALCRRLLKMPELLLTLKKIARPTIGDIQKVLFGTERAGFDVIQRLNILLALEAVQKSGLEWRLTPIGENILESNPPQELPDFSVIEDAISDSLSEDDDMSWEDELGLLDF